MSLKGSYYWNGAPTMRADVSYSQTARTSNTATYKVTVALYFTSGGWFGYGLKGTVNVNGATQTITFKDASPTWSGSGHKGTWTFNVTASAGTGGGTLPASFRMLGQQGDSTDINTGSKTVSLSSWNTAPTWTGEGNVNGWTAATIIPENTTSVTVNLPPAKDNENNTIYTDVARYVNGGRDKTVAGGTSARTVTDNISAVAQGGKIKYSFYMSDGSLFNSTTKYTIEHTKNRFTPATISSNGAKIWYTTTEFNCTVGAATNLHSDKTFTYTLSTNIGIKVYNPTVTGNFTLKVHKSGTAPTTPYILFSDLQNYYKTRDWVGTFSITISSSNKFGSSGTNSSSIAVDLKTAPAPAVLNNPTGTTTVKGTAYYIPSMANIGISWSAATDKLSAGTITYVVSHKVGSNGWQTIGTTTGTSMTITAATIGEISAATTYILKVEARTVYGTSAVSAEKSVTLHYYHTPKVYFRNYYRTESEFSVDVYSETNTSIPTVAITSRHYTTTEGDTPFAGSPYTYRTTGLYGGLNMWIIFTAIDDSGIDLGWGAGVGSEETSTGVYTPIMTVTDEGLFVNVDPELNPSVNQKLNVGGGVLATSDITAGTMRQHSGYDVEKTRLKLYPPYHAGGQWDFVCRDIQSTAYLDIKYGNNTVLSVDSGKSIRGGNHIIADGNIETNKDLKVYGNAVVNGTTTFGSTVNFSGNVDHRGSFRLGGQYEDGAGYYHHTNGYLVKTTLKKSVNSMFELYIKGNSYGNKKPIDVIVNGYVYNGGLTNVSCMHNGLQIYVSAFFYDGDYLHFWFPQRSNYQTFRFKLCSSTGTAYPSYTVSNQAKPSEGVSNLIDITSQSSALANYFDIVETSSNTNGEYTRFADGTQICTKVVEIGNIAITGAWGNVFGSGYKALGNWAAAFVKNPKISAQLTTNSASAWIGAIKADTPTSAGQVELYRGASQSTSGYFWLHLTATGKWK